MATLYQRNGQYYLNYSINGKRIRRAAGPDRKEAEILLGELRYKLFKGDIKPARPEFPIWFFFKKYLENCRARLTNGTFIRYRNSIRHFTRFFTTHHPIQYISQINKGTLQEYILFRQDNKPRPRCKTINIELTVIRAALTWAVDNDWLPANPASRLKLLKTSDSKKGQALTQDEVNALLRGCETLRDGFWFKDILVSFLNTGMRRGELLNLTWDDIDWDQELIKIQSKPFWSPKSYERTIPINQTLKSILDRLQTHSSSIFVFTKNNKRIEDNVIFLTVHHNRKSNLLMSTGQNFRNK